MPANPDVRLDLASPADIDQLFSFMLALRRDDPMPDHDGIGPQDQRAAMLTLLSDPALGRVWLIKLDRRTVGYASLSFTYSLEFGGRCGLLDELYVDLNYRRRGIARGALQWIAESAASSLGMGAIFLELSPGNVAATSLYRSLGFAERPYRLLFRCI